MWPNEAGPSSFFRFKDEWLVSSQAVKLFLFSTIFVVGTIPIFFGHFEGAGLPPWEQLLFGVEGVLGSISIFFLWGGMWRYWIRLDSSAGFFKATSFILLLVGMWFGAVPYYFFVYRPQVAGRSWASPILDEEEERNESPAWGLGKTFAVGTISIFGGMLVFGLLIPFLLREFLSKDYSDDYSTILILVGPCGLIGFLAYRLSRLFRTGMKTRR